MERNGAFDRFRGIGAVCVVFIHSPPLYHSGVAPLRAAGWGLLVLCQVAVPYFFLLSGWMLGVKWAQGRRTWNEFSRSTIRLLRLYVPWFVFFLGLDVLGNLPHGWPEVVRRFAGFSDSRLETRGFHLWFLPSLILAQIASWSVLHRWKSILPVLAVGAVLFGALGWMDLHGGKLPWGLISYEGIDLSLICVATGIWLGNRWGKTPPRIPGVLLLISPPALFLEAFLQDRFGGGPLRIPPFLITRLAIPALLVVWLASHPTFAGRGRVGWFLDLLGKHSTAIYLAHLAFLTLVPFEAWVPNGFLRDNFVRWPAAIAGSIALSMLLKKCPWEPVRRLVA